MLRLLPIGAARSLDAVILFATAQGEHGLKDSAGVTWRPFNVNAASDEVRRAFEKMAEAAGKTEDAYEHLRSSLHHLLTSARDESERRKYLDFLRALEHERLEDDTPIEEVAKDAFHFWETFKSESGLDLRGILRRRALIPFVLFPRHVSKRLSKSDLPSIYQNLRQAHDAFIFGAPSAALALMRSVTEMAVRDHYGGSGSKLDELIESVAALLPKRANAPALHRLRRLANRVLHGEIDDFTRPDTKRRDFELEIVSLLFVLRALIEGAPQASVMGPRHFR